MLEKETRAWYERLSKLLLDKGFKRGNLGNTFFLRFSRKNLLIMKFYADDIIFGSTLKSMCYDFVKLIGRQLEISMMSEHKLFLPL